ncbi:hypothetical protein U5801_23620 [Lamprobacter modestohalophilus]|uniref:hypothetical protein n=1 Tax=Lamprobacter modestohalophilus TaxID=1064514 RepID=UPI002ADEF199|nr:hypothetical protein [Lamprobacter modestohalophilus]MEA1052775.1 hypothetical protein [Lamprobacter modestohalophilus]
MRKPFSDTFRFILTVLLLAWVLPTAAGWKDGRESLQARQPVGSDYEIFYSLSGPHAFPGGLVLEGLAEQINLAVRVYGQELGLAPPLALRRYAEVRRIDVHVLDLGDRSGSAADGVHIFDYQHFGSEGPALTLAISNDWQPPNRTPEHEVFHAYQYAYTFFKNPWFLEGLARSMENLFRDGGWKNEPLPDNDEALEAVLAESYRADRMWNRLALLCDPGCEREPRTLHDGCEESDPPVCGRALVRPLLVALDIADDQAADDRDLSLTYWPEDEQRSEENEPYMLEALADVIASRCPIASNVELAAFHDLLMQRVDTLRRDTRQQ